jgi:hypothetical protein
MGINKHFVRWYNGEFSIKKRKERDKWQLIRNLTNEKMEECKKDEYGFMKKIKGEDTIAAIKVLKIGKVWKVLIYLANKETMKKVFERALVKGISWSFHQFKRPFVIRKIKEVRDEGKGMSSNSQEGVRDRMPSLKQNVNVSALLKTPPQRIFPELTGIIQYQRERHISFQEGYQELKDDMLIVNEQEVVEIVGKYGKGLLDEEVVKSSRSISLKNDNVSPSEVVKIIDKQRKEKKVERFYQKFSWPQKRLTTVTDKINEALSPKLKELKSIFDENESSME